MQNFKSNTGLLTFMDYVRQNDVQERHNFKSRKLFINAVKVGCYKYPKFRIKILHLKLSNIFVCLE